MRNGLLNVDKKKESVKPVQMRIFQNIKEEKTKVKNNKWQVP